MTKLTQAQQAFLASANSETPFARDPKQASTIASLLKKGLIEEIAIADGAKQLQLTDEGKAEVAPPACAQPVAVSPKGKIGQIVDLLRAESGATVEAMVAATGWQKHSVRGAMAGAIKKKLGLSVESEKRDGVRIYRIVPETAA